MTKTLRIARQEILTAVLRPSFLLGSVIAPLFMSLLMIVSGRMGGEAPGAAGNPAENDRPAASEAAGPEGYVDYSGIIQIYPPEMDSARLAAFPDEDAARAALRAGEIEAYYVVPEDYLESGRIVAVRDGLSPWDAFSQSQSPAVEELLNYNLLGGDETLLAQVSRPMELRAVAKSAGSLPRLVERSLSGVFRPMVVAMALYTALMMGASLLVQSLRAERANRTLEVMLLSVSPAQLVGGKIAGLGLVCIGQIGLWAAIMGGMQAFGRPGTAGGLELSLNPVEALAAAVFFLLGFLLYAALLTAAGVLLAEPQQITQVAFLITSPVLLSILVVALIVQMPNGAVARLFGLLPLTAPILLPVRLLVTPLPFWEIAVPAGLLALADLAVIFFVSRLLRAHTLLAGQPFRPVRLVKALLARA